MDVTKVNAQVLDSINTVQQATMIPGVIRASGAGKAYQSVAQSAAIAVQDATDHLRSMNTISSTAVGVAMAQLLANPVEVSSYQEILTQAQDMVKGAAGNFKLVGDSAADLLNSFPSE